MDTFKNVFVSSARNKCYILLDKITKISQIYQLENGKSDCAFDVYLPGQLLETVYYDSEDTAVNDHCRLLRLLENFYDRKTGDKDV